MAVSFGLALCAVRADYVFDPSGWTVQKGAREGVKACASSGEGLLVTVPAAATNAIQLAYRFRPEPLKLTAYPCLEADMRASAGLSGGEFYLISANNAKGGAHVGISNAYKKKDPNWWSHQRDALIGCFHNRKQQVIVHKVNPREALPAGDDVTIRRELAKMSNMTTNGLISLCYLRLPGNRTGKPQTYLFRSVKILDEGISIGTLTRLRNRVSQKSSGFIFFATFCILIYLVGF